MSAWEQALVAREQALDLRERELARREEAAASKEWWLMDMLSTFAQEVVLHEQKAELLEAKRRWLRQRRYVWEYRRAILEDWETRLVAESARWGFPVPQPELD